MAAKRGGNLDFLLPHYVYLRDKEIKKEKEKEKKEEDKEKNIKKIIKKYNKKYKKYIKNYKNILEEKYTEIPQNLPEFTKEEELRKNFFLKTIFIGKKKKPDLPIEYILWKRDEKSLKIKEKNKKYYNKKVNKKKEKYEEDEENNEEIEEKEDEEIEEKEDEENGEEIIIGGIKRSDVFDKNGDIKDYNLYYKYMDAVTKKAKNI